MEGLVSAASDDETLIKRQRSSNANGIRNSVIHSILLLLKSCYGFIYRGMLYLK